MIGVRKRLIISTRPKWFTAFSRHSWAEESIGLFGIRSFHSYVEFAQLVTLYNLNSWYSIQFYNINIRFSSRPSDASTHADVCLAVAATPAMILYISCWWHFKNTAVMVVDMNNPKSYDQRRIQLSLIAFNNNQLVRNIYEPYFRLIYYQIFFIIYWY